MSAPWQGISSAQGPLSNWSPPGRWTSRKPGQRHGVAGGGASISK